MNASSGPRASGPLWNWLFLALLTMALSAVAFLASSKPLGLAAAAAFAALLWQLRPSRQQLFLILMPGLPIVALPFVDEAAGNAAPIAMAALLVWVGIVCSVWRRTAELRDWGAIFASVVVIAVTGAYVFETNPGSILFAPNPVTQLQTASDSGDANAQFVLALRYRNGNGVDQDYAKALDLARRSADQGYAPAETLVGMMYQNGESVAADETVAASYYEKAAAKNDPWAQSLLGGLYLSGEGVEQNNVLAYKWLTKSAAQGNAAAKSLLDAAKDTFTDDERQQGETLAAQN